MPHDGIANVSFQTEQDHSDIDRALRAVVAAKALRDTYAVSWEAERLLQFGDLVTKDTRIYQLVTPML